MKNFTPTLIAYISIWVVLAGYMAYWQVKSRILQEKIKNLEQ